MSRRDFKLIFDDIIEASKRISETPHIVILSHFQQTADNS